MTVIINRPKCSRWEKCGNYAITSASGVWICGDCFIKLQSKLKKLKEKILLEEDFNGDS